MNFRLAGRYMLLQVLYLVGVTWLNAQRGTLEPPPPEAFGWLHAGALQSLL